MVERGGGGIPGASPSDPNLISISVADSNTTLIHPFTKGVYQFSIFDLSVPSFSFTLHYNSTHWPELPEIGTFISIFFPEAHGLHGDVEVPALLHRMHVRSHLSN